MSKSIEEERREHDRLYTECERLKAEVERLKGVIESENLAAAAEVSAIRKSANLQLGKLQTASQKLLDAYGDIGGCKPEHFIDLEGALKGKSTVSRARVCRVIHTGPSCDLAEGHSGPHSWQ